MADSTTSIASDETVMQLLWERHDQLRSNVHYQVPVKLRSTLDADDILQEAYILIWRHAGKAQLASESSFDAWIYKVIRNLVIDKIRAATRAKRGGLLRRVDSTRPANSSTLGVLAMLAHPGRSPSSEAALDEHAAKIARAVDRLPDKYRQIVLHRYMKGMSTRETAQAMQCSERAVESSLLRALKSLRSIILSESPWFQFHSSYPN